MVNTTLVELTARESWGPRMAALATDRQRAFVVAMVDYGGLSHAKAAVAAGYGDSPGGSANSTAARLLRDERVLAAIRELADQRLRAGTLMAVRVLMEQMADPTCDPKVRQGAAKTLLDRTGLHAVSEVKKVHEHSLNTKDAVQKIVNLSAKLGIDPRKLLGAKGIVVDAEFEEILAPERMPVPAACDMTGLEDL